jgi:hypothetical protein
MGDPEVLLSNRSPGFDPEGVANRRHLTQTQTVLASSSRHYMQKEPITVQHSGVATKILFTATNLNVRHGTKYVAFHNNN